MKLTPMPFFIPTIVAAFGLAPLMLMAAASQVSAQSSPILSPDEVTAECLYSRDMGQPDPLAGQGFITVREIEGNTEFSYETIPVPVVAEGASAVTEPRVLLRASRTLIFPNTPLAEARETLFTGESLYYSTLLGLADGETVSDEERSIINDNLECRTLAETPTEPAEPPAEEPPEADPPEADRPEANPDLDLANLPDGNYRVVSASFPMRIVTDEELLASGGALFLFRKFGDQITGTYGFIDHEGGSCITGELSDNQITGDAYGYSDSIRSGVFLTLGEDAGGRRYTDSVLDLSSFSRINAGIRLPVEACP